jgi:hypothetical protein
MSAGCSTDPKTVALKPRDPSKIITIPARTIALTPLQFPGDLPDHDAVRAAFVPLIVETLEEKGFKVVREGEYDSRLEKVTQEAGGFYDAKTGQIDDAKWQAARGRIYAELGEALGVGAVLTPVIVPVTANFGSGSARWDGVSQEVQAGGEAQGIFLGVWTSGSVGALSLNVTIRNMKGEVVYSGYGGIEVLQTLGAGGFNKLAIETLLKNPQRNALAVSVAMRPLAVAPSATALLPAEPATAVPASETTAAAP